MNCCNGNGWYNSYSGGFAHPMPCDRCNSEGSPARPVLARDLGSGPHRPWGAALSPRLRGEIEQLPPIGRTAKLRSLGACKVCGEHNWICDCEDESCR